jgi:glucosamine--fructose-6-phosphate aminotransferase (isomerizing)
MCGIVGYVGERMAIDVLLDGLKRLEYRGYDSVGVAIASEELKLFKDKGELSKIEAQIPRWKGKMGIGHTRWATCGRPSKNNSHPFVDCTGRIALVHNGIIENHLSLRKQLEDEGHVFTSETDTEVLVHLMERHYNGDAHAALMAALSQVKGTYAVAAMVEGDDRIVVSRKENPLVIGLGVGENMVASDVTALLSLTNRVLYLLEGESAIVTAGGITLFDADGNKVEREPSTVTWTVEDAEKGGFEHYMLKEIYEQPTAIHNSLLGSLDEIYAGAIIPDIEINSVKLVACGSSSHAAMVGKYIIEEMARLPTTVELASEYRYSPGTGESPLTILVTQSGETADTLAAAREARQRGCRTLAVTNLVGSTISREADHVFYTNAGPEISVAATKSYITQLMAMYLLGLRLGTMRQTLDRAEVRSLSNELRSMPRYVSGVLDRASEIEEAVDMLAKADHIFYLGRNINYPTMLEGALKLKEISYIHAEGYAAGELKHGPLALLDANTPVVAACVNDHTREKMLGNISEVAARDSPVLGIGVEGDRELEAITDAMICVPKVPPILSPVPLTVVLQLVAYYVAKKRGCSIDRPRNLAKSVTVE